MEHTILHEYLIRTDCSFLHVVSCVSGNFSISHLLCLLFLGYSISVTDCVNVSLQIYKQDDRLARAYFLPNIKYFDQILQTVKSKTTVLILVFREFLQTSIRPLIYVLYAKGFHDFPLKNFCLSAEKFRRGTLLCFRKFLVPKNVRDKRGGGYHDFLPNCLVSQYRKIS